jgi:hypothetical protein
MRLLRFVLIASLLLPLSACADPERALASAFKSWCRSATNCTVHENR